MIFEKNVLVITEAAQQFVNSNLRAVFLLFPGVLEEAEFYNITPLIKLIKERIVERDSKATQVVFQSHAGVFCLSKMTSQSLLLASNFKGPMLNPFLRS